MTTYCVFFILHCVGFPDEPIMYKSPNQTNIQSVYDYWSEGEIQINEGPDGNSRVCVAKNLQMFKEVVK